MSRSPRDKPTPLYIEPEDVTELTHELRQPLFAIKALAQLLHRDVDDPRLAQLLSHVAHLEALVARSGSAAEPETPSIHDLHRPVRTAVAMLGHRAEALGTSLHLAGDSEELLVKARPSALVQVCVNLIHNALDAASQGAAERSVAVRTRADDHHVILEVHDTGPGLPLDVRARLGHPFVTTKRPGEGVGLGLYIASRIVDEHGGELCFPAEGQTGTIARVTLPRC